MLIFSDNRAAYCFEAFFYPFVFPTKTLRLCALSEHPLSAFPAGPRRAARYTVNKSILVRALRPHQETLAGLPHRAISRCKSGGGEIAVESGETNRSGTLPGGHATRASPFPEHHGGDVIALWRGNITSWVGWDWVLRVV